MIRLSNGHRFEYMAAGGALGYDGQGWPWEQPLRWLDRLEPRLFTVVTKTLTPQATKGNLRWTRPWDCVRFIPHGLVNAVGLSNPGFGWWCQQVERRLNKSSPPLVVSITVHDGEIDQLALMAGRLSQNRHVVGIEFNPSCPNTSVDLATNANFIIAACQAIKERTELPLLLKLSVRHPAEDIVTRLGGTVEALSINSVPWAFVYPAKPSPLAHHGGGGVSGGAAQVHTWAYARRLHQLAHLPIIGPSIWWFDDLMSLRRMGMSALSFGSIFLRYPWRPTLYVRRDRAHRRRNFRHIQKANPFCT